MIGLDRTRVKRLDICQRRFDLAKAELEKAKRDLADEGLGYYTDGEGKYAQVAASVSKSTAWSQVARACHASADMIRRYTTINTTGKRVAMMKKPPKEVSISPLFVRHTGGSS